LLPLLNSNKNAFIINTTSGLGAFPKSDGLVYSAGKAAMRNFTIGLRCALRRNSIGVLEMIPPVTDTAMTASRNGSKMPVEAFVELVIPQLRKERKLITTGKMRIFLRIAYHFPALANKILSK
jgi:short-subunit dehydrogenase involved in D-alanine esterification of teichoic acids